MAPLTRAELSIWCTGHNDMGAQQRACKCLTTCSVMGKKVCVCNKHTHIYMCAWIQIYIGSVYVTDVNSMQFTNNKKVQYSFM